MEDIKNISNYIKNLVLESWFFNMLLYLWTCIVLIKSDSDTNRGEFNTLHYIWFLTLKYNVRCILNNISYLNHSNTWIVRILIYLYKLRCTKYLYIFIIYTSFSNNLSCYLKCAFESQVRTPKHVNTIYILNIYKYYFVCTASEISIDIFCYHRFSLSFRFISYAVNVTWMMQKVLINAKCLVFTKHDNYISCIYNIVSNETRVNVY